MEVPHARHILCTFFVHIYKATLKSYSPLKATASCSSAGTRRTRAIAWRARIFGVAAPDTLISFFFFFLIQAYYERAEGARARQQHVRRLWLQPRRAREYAKRARTQGINITLVDDEWIDDNAISRTDPIMVGVVRDLGEEQASDAHSHLTIRMIPAVFKRHYRIHEYDGLETIQLLYARWFVDQARDVLLSSSDDDANKKVQALNGLLSAYAEHSGVQAAHVQKGSPSA